MAVYMVFMDLVLWPVDYKLCLITLIQYILNNMYYIWI